jgi:hypothetical protein
MEVFSNLGDYFSLSEKEELLLSSVGTGPLADGAS